MPMHEKPVRGETDTWLTPPEVIHALGPFDLDPCAAPSPRPWPTASRHIELPEDGLDAEWAGRVWCNPPYGPSTGKWLHKMAMHGRGTALVAARTETGYWHRWVWPYASAVLFVKGRICFCFPNGDRSDSSGFPSAFIAYGHDDAERLQNAGFAGAFIDLRRAIA